MRGQGKFVDELTPFVWMLGVVANFAAIVTPLVPKAATWMSMIFLTFAALFWIGILFKRMKFRNKNCQTPRHMHSDWDATSIVDRMSITSESSNDNIKLLESLALRLLVADRIETGGWSKTQVWRFVRANKPLSPVGTLTGTYFTAEALRPYGYLNTSEAAHLTKNLGEIIAPDGRVKREVQLTGTGIAEIVAENLRHASALFLLRSSVGAPPTPADKNCAIRIAAELAARIEVSDSLKGSREEKDMMGTAFATVALLAAELWFETQNSKYRDLVRLSIQSFCKSNELSTPGHPAWGAEGGGSAAAETAAQWCTVWLLGSIVDWEGIEANLRAQLADSLLDLVEANIAAVKSSDMLLPYAFSRDSIRAPIGESLLATATACYVTLMIMDLQCCRSELKRAERLANDLLHRIVVRGVEYASKAALYEPYEGYLSWSALLLALRPVLHPVPHKTAGQPEELWLGVLNNFDNDMLIDALGRIQDLYKEAGVSLKSNGLLRDIS